MITKPVLVSIVVGSGLLLAQSAGAATAVVELPYRNGFESSQHLKSAIDYAIAHLESELENQPRNVEMQFALGSLYFEFQPDKAKQQFQEILRIDPNHAESNFLLGMIVLSEKDLKGFATHLEKAIQSDPIHVQAYNTLAMWYAKTGRLERAVQLLEQGKAHVANEESFYFNQSLMLLDSNGQYDSIIKNMETAIKLAPKEEYYFILGWAYHKQRAYDAARVTMQKVMELNPKNVNALMVIATTYKETGDLEKARTLVEEALTIDPANKTIQAELQEYKEEYKKLDKPKKK
ncbi:MAG: tetratricopeptide repeat protein [Nitrospira sp.]|nr:tetratricopeptide repeat protein [Nitrospira sp.]